MIARDELAAWLRLVETPGLGRGRVRRLLAAFGSAEQVLAADEAALHGFIGPALTRALLGHDERRDALADLTWRWLEAAAPTVPRQVLVLGDPGYPPLLLQTADPPLLLYTMGRVALLGSPGVAVVGSRHATPQGLANAHDFARHLSQHRFTIVSGLALGVDGAAHGGGLAGRGSTIAFVGTGLDQTYPKRHLALGQRIAEEGLLASEYPLGMPPLPVNFPRRNRLIAGVTQGTLVVEAALQSGSLITARMALESGREVFAIPGSIHSPQARGCHRLIQEGAKLVQTPEDVRQELRPDDAAPVRASITPRQPSLFAEMREESDSTGDRSQREDPDRALLEALGHDPVTLDALAARTGLPSDRLAGRLLQLELDGAVQRLPGGLLQRRAIA